MLIEGLTVVFGLYKHYEGNYYWMDDWAIDANNNNAVNRLQLIYWKVLEMTPNDASTHFFAKCGGDIVTIQKLGPKYVRKHSEFYEDLYINDFPTHRFELIRSKEFVKFDPLKGDHS